MSDIFDCMGEEDIIPDVLYVEYAYTGKEKIIDFCENRLIEIKSMKESGRYSDSKLKTTLYHEDNIKEIIGILKQEKFEDLGYLCVNGFGFDIDDCNEQDKYVTCDECWKRVCTSVVGEKKIRTTIGLNECVKKLESQLIYKMKEIQKHVT